MLHAARWLQRLKGRAGEKLLGPSPPVRAVRLQLLHSCARALRRLLVEGGHSDVAQLPSSAAPAAAAAERPGANAGAELGADGVDVDLLARQRHLPHPRLAVRPQRQRHLQRVQNCGLLQLPPTSPDERRCGHHVGLHVKTA